MRLEKMKTGVAGLDLILGGGLLKAGVYMVQGAAGSGKTILANQIAFSHVAAGGKVAYVTLLAENHARMIQHLELFSFYDESVVPSGINYLSAFDALSEHGLGGVVSVLNSEMRRQRADLVVLDGLVNIAGASGSSQELKLFVSQIQAMSMLAGCNTLLLNSVGPSHHQTPEQTMVDGIVLLRQQIVRSRHERTLEVTKFRGSLILYGAHTFRIGDEGVTIFPQLEALPATLPPREPLRERVSTGVDGLDAMLAGGYPQGSVTAVTGPEGSGKTLTGLQYLARGSEGESSLFFGLGQSNETAVGIADAFQMGLEALRRRGILHLAGQPHFAESLDEVGYRLLHLVESTGARRLFIDGLGSVVATPAYEERGAAFFAALFERLRRLGTTTLFSVRTGMDDRGRNPFLEVSPLADNTVHLSIIERNHKFVRAVSIGKVQASRQDVSIRQLELRKSGLRVAASIADLAHIVDD